MAFDENYFSTEQYAKVSFRKYSQYWWANRFYSLLAKRFSPQEGKLLEVGCGLGHLMTFFSSDYKVYGGDINLYALKTARQIAPNAHILAFPAEDLRMFPRGFFQVIICKHIVEHLPEPGKAIAEFSRALAPGGVVIISAPNMRSPMRERKGKDWIGYQDPTHISLLQPEEWETIIERQGLTILKKFTDGFWDAPYIKGFPSILQKLWFGLPGGIQAILGGSFLTLNQGETVIFIAKNQN
ncbi:MAG: class I SAM-dependent methyltransferase [Anaerolineales bacterium]|nr:class I SAM-dependent methyltransferase [Anaerolineales bacterium]